MDVDIVPRAVVGAGEELRSDAVAGPFDHKDHLWKDLDLLTDRLVASRGAFH